MSTQIAAAGLKDSEYKAAATNQAAKTLYREDNPKERDIANGIKNLFGAGEGFNSSQLTEDLYKRLKVQYANLIATDPDKNAILDEGLKPISSFIGSTLLNLTGMQEDSLGSKFDMPQTLSSMLEKMNPELHAKFKSSYESFNVQKLTEMPSQLFGNSKQLSQSASLSGDKKQTNLPTELLPQGLQNAYRGMEDLVGKANDFVTSSIEGILKQLSNVEKIIPKEVSGLLNNTNQFTGQIENLTKQFANVEQLKGITDKLNLGNLNFNSVLQDFPLDSLKSLNPASFGNIGSIDQLTSLLKENPLQNIMQGGLPDVGGILNKPTNIIQDTEGNEQIPTQTNNTKKPTFSLPDPKEALKGFLPSQLTDGLANINNIPGLGFTGNMSFGFEKALEGIGGDVLGGILQKFAGQLPFLASTLLGTAGPNDQPDNYPSNEATTTPAPDGSVTYVTDPTSGTVIKPSPPKPVYGTPFEAKNAQSQNNTGFQFGATGVRNAFPEGGLL